MLTLPGGFAAHLEEDATRLTISGVIYRKDGVEIRCTQHDRNITITTGALAGVYRMMAPITSSDVKSGSDLSVDNLEMESAFEDELIFTGFTVQDIESGLFDNAPFETFLHRWDAPDEYQKIIRRGYLGEITRSAEGEFKAEWRGLTQILQQVIGRTYGERCDVKRFGDARCGLDVVSLTLNVNVTAVTSRKRFTVDVAATGSFPFARYFELGQISFESSTSGGMNAGFSRQIKRAVISGSLVAVETWEAFPYDVEVGEVAMMAPGCDRRWETCLGYSNTVNFRGHGRWIPGIPKIIRAP